MSAVPERGFLRRILLMLAGLVVWGLQFTLIYGFNAIACARGFADSDLLGLPLVPAVIVSLTVLALAATAAVVGATIRGRFAELLREEAEDGSFMRALTITIGLLSLVAIVWSGLPALMVAACG